MCVFTHVFLFPWKCRLETGPPNNLGLFRETPGLPWRGAPGTDSMLGDGRTFPVQKKTGITPGRDGEGTSMLEGLLRARTSCLIPGSVFCSMGTPPIPTTRHIGLRHVHRFRFDDDKANACPPKERQRGDKIWKVDRVQEVSCQSDRQLARGKKVDQHGKPK